MGLSGIHPAKSPLTQHYQAGCSKHDRALFFVGVMVLAFALSLESLAQQTRAYVAGCDGATVIDTASNTVLATIPLHGLPGSNGVAITQDGSKVYVTNFDTTVSVIDAATNAVISTIPVDAAGDTKGIAVTPDATRLYVTDEYSRSVFVIDTASGNVTGGFFGLDGIFYPGNVVAITPDGSQLYVAGFGSVEVINIATNSVAPDILGDLTSVIAFAPDGTRAYVAGVGSIQVIDTASQTIIDAIPVAATALAISPDGNRAYSVNWSQGNVSVIDIATKSVTATIPVAIRPVDIALTPDGTRAYVTAENSDVSVIDTASNTIIATVPIVGCSRRLAITPRPMWPVAIGSNVVVKTPKLSLDFAGVVTAAGTVNVVPTDPATIGLIPGGFSVSSTVAYQINTNAIFTGPVSITFKIPGPINANDFDNLQILHFNSGTGQLETLPLLASDFNNLTITVTTTSFSPFYLTRKGLHVSALYDQTKVSKLGSTIPIKVQILDSNNVNLSSASMPLVARAIKLISTNTDNTPVTSGNANPDDNFRYDPTIGNGGGYIFNLSTKSLAVGKYSLSFFLGTKRSFFYAVQFEVR